MADYEEVIKPYRQVGLTKTLLTFVPKHIKECIDNPELDYQSHGTESEIKLKQILNIYTNIAVVLRDIDLTLRFLEKDRDTILDHYPFLDSQKAFFKYHFENYFIRIVTLLDLIGKIGTLVYQIEIPIQKATAYKFKDKARKLGYDEIVVITESLIDKLNQLRTERHNKLHTGEADLEPFNKTVIWEDLLKIINDEVDPILSEHIDKEIKNQLKELKEFTNEIIQLIEAFMDEAALNIEDFINNEDE